MARLVNQKCLQSGLVPMISVGCVQYQEMWISQDPLQFTPFTQITFILECSQPSHKHMCESQYRKANSQLFDNSEIDKVLGCTPVPY